MSSPTSHIVTSSTMAVQQYHPNYIWPDETHLIFSTLWLPCYHVTSFQGRHMSLSNVLFLCAIGDICCLRIISLNFAGLLQQSVLKSAQFPMMSPARTRLCTQTTFKTMTRHFVEFVWYLGWKSDHFMAHLGENSIEYVSEMEMYIILSTLEKFECWN